jgi:hypothetical protein
MLLPDPTDGDGDGYWTQVQLSLLENLLSSSNRFLMIVTSSSFLVRF